jgi:hypothetical protein
VDRVAPLETMRDKVRASVIKNNSSLALARFRKEVFDEYDFSIDEDVLHVVFDALPQDVDLSDPPPIEDLAPLKLAPADLGRVLMKYADQEWTVRRYSDYYDATGVYGRPRRENGIGGLRAALTAICIRELMPIVAKDRGYMDKPAVRDEFKLRREQSMVSKLYDETVRGSVQVSPQDVEDYWRDHSEDFVKPAHRKVLAVVTSTEADGLAAQLAAKSGMKWPDLIDKYCIAGPVKQAKGVMPDYYRPDQNPVAAQAFRLSSVGDVSYPVKIGPDQWLVVKLTELVEEVRPTLKDVKPEVGRIVQSKMEEAAFQDRVNEWKKDIEIETYPDRLMDAVYKPAEKSSDVLPVNATVPGTQG